MVIADYEPNDDFETAMLAIIAHTPPELGFVMTSIDPPSRELAALAQTGMVRVTSQRDLSTAYGT